MQAGEESWGNDNNNSDNNSAKTMRITGEETTEFRRGKKQGKREIRDLGFWVSSLWFLHGEERESEMLHGEERKSEMRFRDLWV